MTTSLTDSQRERLIDAACRYSELSISRTDQQGIAQSIIDFRQVLNEVGVNARANGHVVVNDGLVAIEGQPRDTELGADVVMATLNNATAEQIARDWGDSVGPVAYAVAIAAVPRITHFSKPAARYFDEEESLVYLDLRDRLDQLWDQKFPNESPDRRMEDIFLRSIDEMYQLTSDLMESFAAAVRSFSVAYSATGDLERSVIWEQIALSAEASVERVRQSNEQGLQSAELQQIRRTLNKLPRALRAGVWAAVVDPELKKHRGTSDHAKEVLNLGGELFEEGSVDVVEFFGPLPEDEQDKIMGAVTSFEAFDDIRRKYESTLDELELGTMEIAGDTEEFLEKNKDLVDAVDLLLGRQPSRRSARALPDDLGPTPEPQ